MLPTVTALVAPPVPPSTLGERGRDVWGSVWAEGAAWLTPADESLVRRVAELGDEIAAAREALLTEGVILRKPLISPKGDVVGEEPIANPAARMLRDATSQLAVLAGALGLSPASRARLGLTAARARRLAGGSGGRS